MPAYCIFDVKKINNQSLMESYRNSVTPIVEKYGGRYIAVGGPFVVIEGKPEVTFPVIIEFPTLAKAKDWYNSNEYKPARELREKAADTNAYFIEGLSS